MTKQLVHRIFSSWQIAAAIVVEVQKSNLPPCFLQPERGVRAFLSVLFLSINQSLSPLTPLTLRWRQDRWLRLAAVILVSSGSRLFFLSLYFFFFSFFPPISLRSLFLPSSIPILFAVSALLFTFFFPSVFCFPLGVRT